MEMLLLLLVAAITGGAAAERNIITHIKGFDGPLPFSLETGYVEVEETHGVELFYSFIPSERDPQGDPLVLWLSGGPGCSGLNALFFEIGPLRWDVAGYTEGSFPRLLHFADSWTKVSNVIFLDAPVGTGFSYAREAGGLNVTLSETGGQIRIFLEKWLADHHPSLASNPLYIAGDSYSGLTVPVVALEIADRGRQELNLKGYMVGNGVTDELFDIRGRLPFMHGMGLISDELYMAARASCRGDDLRNLRCGSAMDAISTATSDLNPMNILEPLCTARKEDPTPATSRLLVQQEEEDCRASRDEGYKLAHIWANDVEVRESLGVRDGTTATWDVCTNVSHFETDVRSTISYHRNLTQRGYRALVYNGDHDLKVPFVSTQSWIRTLGYPVVAPWRPWYSNRQVAGFTTEYAYNLTFATVKGAGHMAPESRPKECLDMLHQWTSSTGRLSR